MVAAVREEAGLCRQDCRVDALSRVSGSHDPALYLEEGHGARLAGSTRPSLAGRLDHHSRSQHGEQWPSQIGHQDPGSSPKGSASSLCQTTSWKGDGDVGSEIRNKNPFLQGD